MAAPKVFPSWERRSTQAPSPQCHVVLIVDLGFFVCDFHSNLCKIRGFVLIDCSVPSLWHSA